MKHIFILNPAAGRINSFGTIEAELKQVYTAGGLDYMIYETKAPGTRPHISATTAARTPNLSASMPAVGTER